MKLEHSSRANDGGRFRTTEEIAPAVAFLASRSRRFINGANLTVDGGRN